MIEIYTDGSCQNNQLNVPNTGGIGIVIIKDKKIEKVSKGYKDTTNNKMELLAIVRALLICLKNNWTKEKIIIYSDSQYCVNGCSKWVNNWEKRGFRKKNDSLLNSELWIMLYELKIMFEDLTFQWVKGHNDNLYNEMADQLSVVHLDDSSLL